MMGPPATCSQRPTRSALSIVALTRNYKLAMRKEANPKRDDMAETPGRKN